MKYSTICAAFLAAAVAASDVKQLNKDTFKAFVEENDLVLAECKCFSPWSSSTKALKDLAECN
jgi:protein disulfide-isomerase A1